MFQAIQSWDTAALVWVHGFVTFQGAIAGIWMSELASATTVIGVVGIAAVLLIRQRRFHDLAGFIVSAGGATLVAHLLKLAIERTRPPFKFASYLEAGSSFPSAHAAVAIGLYGFIAWLVWRDCAPRVWRITAVVAAVILTLAIGISRVYEGVHYPSDVLAGYCIGALFLLAGILITRRGRDRNLC